MYELNIKRTSPQNLLEWLEDFCLQLECDKPERPLLIDDPRQEIRYYENLSSWETQQAILKKLRFATDSERRRMEKERGHRENKVKYAVINGDSVIALIYEHELFGRTMTVSGKVDINFPITIYNIETGESFGNAEF